MKFDGRFLVGGTPDEMIDAAIDADRRGYDGWFSTDSAHDPFLPIAVAARETRRIELGTAVAVAFARNPMTVAYTANDLQALTGGRFILGLGSQVEAHVTKRFSMPWSDPAPRMREFVEALLAIWEAWNTGTRLRFEGQHYRHTLMNPNFTPAPNPHGRPRVYVAGLGARMSEVAGAVADGVILHPFTTASYLRDVTWPAIEAGLASSGRSRDDFEVVLPCFLAVGDDRDLGHRMRKTASQIAFYGSTPAYRGVLDTEGRGSVHEGLHELSRNGRWSEMGALVDDDLLRSFCAVGNPDEVAEQLVGRYGDVVDRISPYTPYELEMDELDEVQRAVRRRARPDSPFRP